MKVIPHSRPLVGRAEKDALCRVIDSSFLSGGKEVLAFEREMARALGRHHGVAVNSGTAALALALSALDVTAGDRVALPSYVCSALLHALEHVGAEPVLVDIDPATFNLDPDDLRRRLRRGTKAVVVPHMFGLPAQLEAIKGCGLPIVEDCALAVGAFHEGRPVGSFGALAIVSFYATKMIATGEGGMVVADRASLLHEVVERRSYDGRTRYRPRFNFKMTELQAAVGRAQLKQLVSFVHARRRLAARYYRELGGGPWELPSRHPEHVYYRFVIMTSASKRLLRELERRGIQARRPVFRPLHRYLQMEGFPGTEEAYRRAVSLPLYPALTPAERRRVPRVTRVVGRQLGR